MQLTARIRAICIVFALLMVPGMVQAYDVYLLTSQTINGKEGSYDMSHSEHKFTQSSGTEYTYTINSMPTGGTFSFRIGVGGWDNNLQPYNDGDALNINGSSYTISKDCYGKTNAWKVSYKEGEYSSLTITVDISDNTDKRYVKITGVKGSSGGGGSSITTCAPGLYIYGEKYGKKGDQYIYKLQRSSDEQYYISLNAINGAEWSNVQSYETGQGIDNYTISTIGQTFHLVYVDANGNETAYYPSTSGYGLTGTDTNVGSSHTNLFSTTASNNWSIGALNSSDPNGGIYNFYVNTNVNGMPQNWYYEPDETRIVAYEVNSSTNTTDAYLYGRRANKTANYNKNFFGMASFVKDGYLTYLFGGVTYGRRKNSNSTHDMAVAAYSPNAMQFDKDGHDTGIYSTEFNPTRDYIITGDKKPTRIFIIGSAINPELSDTYTTWDPSNAVEMIYDSEEGCYKTTITLNKDKQFRFLLDHNTTGEATSLSDNFGEDANLPGNGGDTDYNNKVEVESSSTSGKNIVFNPETKTYVIRFYVERKADKEGFQWTNDYGIYRYTIEGSAHLSTTITPPTATVAYGASLTPKVEVNDPNNRTKRIYAYTIDGSAPTIDANGNGTGTTKVVTYNYDEVIPTSDLGTFYMEPGNVLTFIYRNGDITKTTELPGTTVTVKVQAVYEVGARIGTPGDKTPDYYLDGNIATGVYTFEPAGAVPGGDYTLTVTNKETVSVNKVVADVVVTNKATGKDDGVDVYYTTDGSDPTTTTSPTGFKPFLVRNRKITIYAKPGDVSKSGTIKVFTFNPINRSIIRSSCNYDLTYSTSEGGYLNYQNNSTGNTIGGDGHVVVYVQPYSSDKEGHYDANDARIYAYEKLTDGSHASLNIPQTPFTLADTTTVKGEKWYYFDLEPSKNSKEVSVLLGYIGSYSNATVANACKDMFLKFDMATGQIIDVTHAYTGDHFYTTGEGGTKTEAANPSSKEAFIYVQVPAPWVKGNSVKVLNKDAELSGASVEVQGAAETSNLSRVCKISVPTTLADKTELTIKPYKGETPSSLSFPIEYQNGGYYFYESSVHYSTKAPLVFSPDADTDKDYRSKGRRDINHVTKGDKTNYLANSWTYSPELASGTSETESIKDNWNKAESAKVNVIPTGTTISQTVTGLSTDSTYTVQMIVRGKNGAKGTMTLEGATTTTDELNLSGYDAQGVITADGRVEYLLNNDATKNGWQKLEASVKPATDGTVTVKLTANGNEMQLSDVTLLENANTKGHVWTTAPTSNETTEYDLSDRKMANAFSFFDRGDNKNAIIYANANTVLGMSENTYDVAVAIPASSPAKAIHRASDSAQDGTTPEYSMHRLALTDAGTAADNQRTSSYTFNITKDNVTTESFSYDRNYNAGIMSSFCLPVALTKDQLSSMGVSTIYEYTGLKVETGKDTEVQFTEHNVSGSDEFTTKAGMPYIVKFSSAGSFAADAEMAVAKGNAGTSSDGVFIGSYAFQTLRNSDASNPTLFFYSGSANSLGKFTPAFADELGTNMKAFRGYFDFSKYASPAKKYVFVLVKGFDQPTGISDINTDVDDSKAPIYNLSGQLVRKDGNRNMLPKGLYIQDNNKFIIK